MTLVRRFLRPTVALDSLAPALLFGCSAMLISVPQWSIFEHSLRWASTLVGLPFLALMVIYLGCSVYLLISDIFLALQRREIGRAAEKTLLVGPIFIWALTSSLVGIMVANETPHSGSMNRRLAVSTALEVFSGSVNTSDVGADNLWPASDIFDVVLRFGFLVASTAVASAVVRSAIVRAQVRNRDIETMADLLPAKSQENRERQGRSTRFLRVTLTIATRVSRGEQNNSEPLRQRDAH
jgi:hypothetical protein